MNSELNHLFSYNLILGMVCVIGCYANKICHFFCFY